MIVDFNSETWTDPWFRKLTTEQKLLFIYLWSNSHKNVAGMYVLDKQIMAFETGLSDDAVDCCLTALYPKIRYDEDSQLVWVVNHVRHQFLKSGKLSPKISVGISKNLMSVMPHPYVDAFFHHYPNVTDTLSEVRIPYQNSGYSPGAGEGAGKGKGEGAGARKGGRKKERTTKEDIEEYDF